MILDNKNGLLLNIKGNYCNDNIFVQLSENDFNALVSTNIKKGITILGVTGNLESTTTTVCTCDVPTIDNLETPGENNKYYYYNGNIYVYNNGYKLLGETIPEVDVLPTTGQEGSLVYCNNVLHKYIDNDWKELSVLEDEVTYTPTHSIQEYTNKKKVTVNAVTVPNITETEFNSPTVSKDTLVYYNQKIYKCVEQSDKSKGWVLYPNKEEVALTVSEDNAITVSGAGLKSIKLPDPPANSVYGSVGEVYISVDAESIDMYEASESLPDGEDGEIVKHGEIYKVWQDGVWNTLDIIDNATEHTVTFTKDGYIKDDELLNKIVVPGLTIVPVTEFPENSTEDDLVYKDDKIYIYKSNEWVEYIKDTYTFAYITNQTTYEVPDGLSAKKITITGLTQEGTVAALAPLEITPDFLPQTHNANLVPDINGYNPVNVKAVHVVDDGTLPKNDDGTAKYKNLNEMRYFEGRIYKIHSTSHEWVPYEGNIEEYTPKKIEANGDVNWTAPEGTYWKKVSFTVGVPQSGLIKDYTSLQSASGLVATVGAIVHIPSKDDSGNSTWGTLYKRNELGRWDPLVISASVIQDTIEPTYTLLTIEAGRGDYINTEAFTSISIAGVQVINWTNPDEPPTVAIGKKVYMTSDSHDANSILPNGLTNGIINQYIAEDTWVPVKPLQDKTVTKSRNEDSIVVEPDSSNFGLSKVTVKLEGAKSCTVISDYTDTYDTNAPLTHIDNDIPTFTATATDDTPVQIHLKGKHIGNDIKINAYIPKINAIYTPENLSEHPVITAKELVSTSDIDNWTYKWWYADSYTGEYKEYDAPDKYYKSQIKNVIFNNVTVDLSKIKLTGITLEESTINNILLSRTGYDHTPSTGLYYTKVKIPRITIPDCTNLYDSNLNAPNGTRVCFTGEYNGVTYDHDVMRSVESSSGTYWVPDTGNIQPETVINYMTYEGIYNADTGYDATKQIKFKYPCVKQHYGELILGSATANDYNKYCITMDPETNEPSKIYKGDLHSSSTTSMYEWKPLGTMYQEDAIVISAKSKDTWLKDYSSELKRFESVRSDLVKIKGAQVPVYDTLPLEQIELENLIAADKLYGYHNGNIYKILIIDDEPKWIQMYACDGTLNITENGEYDIAQYARVKVQVGVEEYPNPTSVSDIDKRDAKRIHICYYGGSALQRENKLKLIFTVNHGFGTSPSTEIRYISIPSIATVQKNLDNYNNMYLSTIYINGVSFDIGVRYLEGSSKLISLYIYDSSAMIGSTNTLEGISAIQYAFKY